MQKAKPGAPEHDMSRLQTGKKLESWWIAISVIALTPLIHTIMTWDSDGLLSSRAFAMRHFSVPVMLLEIGMIFLAITKGFELKTASSNWPRGLKILVTIWFAFAMFSCFLHTGDAGLSLFITFRYMLHGLVLAAVVFVVSMKRSFDIYVYLKILTIGAIAYLLALVVFIALIAEPDSFAWVLRLPSATNVRQIGNNLSLLAIAPIVLILARDTSNRLAYIVTVSLIVAFVTWTGTRGGLFGLTVGIMVAILATKEFTTIRNVGLLLASSILGLLISFPLFKPDPQFGLFRIVSSISSEDASSGRIDIWGYTINEIAKRPFLGFGSGRYRDNMRELYDFDFNHPHNVVLQYVYDWGIIGGGAGLLILSWLGIRLFSTNDNGSSVRFVSIAGFTATLAISMIEGTLFHPLPIFICIALVSPALIVKK